MKSPVKYTASEEDTLARFIAGEAFNKFNLSSEDLKRHFKEEVSWAPWQFTTFAPVRPAVLTGAANERVGRKAVAYVREWETRRLQGAD